MVDNPNVTFTQCSAAVWSLLEMNLGIICNALAALKPFVRRYLPAVFSLTGSRGSNAKTGGSYAKHTAGSRAWGHSYQLHSAGGSTKEQARTERDIVVVDQFSVEYDKRPQDALGSGKGGSTDSILAPHFPEHQAV